MNKTHSLILILAFGATTEIANADFVYGEATNLGPTVNSSASDYCPRISTDGLSLYFPSARPGGIGGRDIYVATRATTSVPWGTPVNLGPTVNSSADDYSLSISADDLALYFVSTRSGGSGAYDIWVTARASKDEPWEAPMNLGPTVNSPADDYSVGISSDGRRLYFTSNRGGGSGGYDVWVTTRSSTDAPWNSPVNLGSNVNSSSNEYTLGVAGDGRTVYTASDRPGGYGSLDIWVANQANANLPWSEAMNLGPAVNSGSIEGFPGPSADGRTLYFSSNRSGGSGNVDLWQIPIAPIVDFNGDGMVDSADMGTMVNHWGTDKSLCDIAPMPWGDGIVDAQDLVTLSEYLFEEINDPTLLAHWALDETEGMFTTERVSGNNDLVLGNPVWQPEGGQVNGALEFDGIDDMIIAKPVLNPGDGPFSVFAWIKGGAPGQVIMLQQTGVNWLQVDVDGTLMTELAKSGGRTTGIPLYSEAVITDDNWHRVGFTWDGSDRILYVDDIPVALDSQSGLDSSTGGLLIGAGPDNRAGSFWSGMIDDVRIYDRVVGP
jgi:hypothetical protein